MSASIRLRLILFLLVPFLLLRFLDAFFDYYVNVADARLSTQRQLSDTARMIASGLMIRDTTFDASYAVKVVEPLTADNVIRYAVRDADGKLIVGDPAVPTLVPGLTKMTIGEGILGEQPTPLATYRTKIADKNVRIDVAAGTASDLDISKQQMQRDLLWDFFELDVSLLLIWFGVAKGLKPLEALRSEVDARSAHDLGLIDVKGRPTELLPFVRSLNRLFETLANLLAAQQQFISNAAHQLRTPIAGLTAQLELLKSEPLPDMFRQRFESLSLGVRSLGRAANQLLTLARVESAAAALERRRTSELSIVVANVVGRFLDRAVASNIELSVDTEATKIRGDSAMIEELLSNLVDNALKYTPSGGSVSIQCGEKNGEQFLAVEDNGPGIPISERKRVFERFYRPPGSIGDGTGLGLAIAQEIARAARATISIASGAGDHGTRVEVLWRKVEARTATSA